MKTRTDIQALVIKVAAVVAAVSRWTGALLEAEGFSVPEGWLSWWVPTSALMAVGMAVVEAFALSYIFSAWKKDRGNNLLLYAAILSSVIFIWVLAPYTAAQVSKVPLSAILANPTLLWGWSAAVGASTVVTVVSVGMAERRQDELSLNVKPPEYGVVNTPNGWLVRCECGWQGGKIYETEGYANSAYMTHKRHCSLEEE